MLASPAAVAGLLVCWWMIPSEIRSSEWYPWHLGSFKIPAEPKHTLSTWLKHVGCLGIGIVHPEWSLQKLFLEYSHDYVWEAGNMSWCFEIIGILHDTPASYDFHERISGFHTNQTTKCCNFLGWLLRVFQVGEIGWKRPELWRFFGMSRITVVFTEGLYKTTFQ